MKKIIALSAVLLIAFSSASMAAKPQKKKPKSRSDYSREERAALHKKAIEACRNVYGGILVRVEVDYRHGVFKCWTR